MRKKELKLVVTSYNCRCDGYGKRHVKRIIPGRIIPVPRAISADVDFPGAHFDEREEIVAMMEKVD